MQMISSRVTMTWKRDRILLRAFVVLITGWSVAQPCTCINNGAPATDTWPNKCRRPPSDPQPPNIEDLELDHTLPVGVHHMNLQARAAQKGSLVATFVFGNVGSGKSTVIPLIVGDPDKLNVWLKNTTSSFIYRNENQIISKSTSSRLMQLLPSFYVSQSGDLGKVAVFNCPGFSYSRGSNADIAQLYFLKHALEITKSATFIFTITYSSVKLVSDVRMLANHATTLMKDVGKFKDSIGLIVTEIVEDSVRTEEEILFSIRNFLRSYIETEQNVIKHESDNGSYANEPAQLRQRIRFIELLLEEEGGDNETKSRICLIKSLEFCSTSSNMSVVSDTVANLDILQYSTLKPAKIHIEDFGLVVRKETRQEIKNTLWAKQIKGVAKYTVEASQGMIKELGRTLLGSQNYISTLELLNGFRNALDHEFGQTNDRNRPHKSFSSAKFNLFKNDIDLFVSCSSQKLKTIQFLKEVMGDTYKAVTLSTLSEPFKIAGAKVSKLAEFYNFCSQTYHALGEYSTQVYLKEMKKKSEINVHNDNVLEFLANASIEIPNNISTVWMNKLDKESRKYLIDLVRIQIPNIKFLSHISLTNTECYRADIIGRNVMLSDVVKWFEDFVSGYCKVEINVVATENFYVDRSIVTDGQMNPHSVWYLRAMSVVAPVWEVVPTGTSEIRGIDLQGVRPFASFSARRGGVFFGLYTTMVNSSKLFIGANGGNSTTHCYGGDAGFIRIANTSGNVTIQTEACPGLGHFLAGFKDLNYMPMQGIFDYNSEYVHTSFSHCLSPESDQLFEKLDAYMDFQSIPIDPLFLVNEIEKLEHTFYRNANNIHSCPAKIRRRLTIYYKRTLKHITITLGRVSDEENTALTWIGSLIIGRLINSRRLAITLDVVNTEQYLEAVEEDLMALEIIEHKVAINKDSEKYKNALVDKVNEAERYKNALVEKVKEAEKYKNALAEKVKEAENLIGTLIQPAITKAEQMINKMNKELLVTLDAFLKATEETMEEAKIMENGCKTPLIVKIVQMKNMLKHMPSMVKGFAGWISGAHKQIKDNARNVLRVRDLYEYYISSIETLEMTIVVLFELYNKIEMYQERKHLANFIANVPSPTTGELQLIRNKTLRDALTRVSISIKINLAVEEYKKAEKAFRQWVFPFSSYYLKSNKELDFMKSNNFTDVVSSCKKEISRFGSVLRKSHTVLSVPDQHLYHYNFTGDAVSTRPFYVWTNENWRNTIRKLFQGEGVQLKADVDMLGEEHANFFRGKSAIKFKHIGLFIKTRDKSQQGYLDEKLNNFRMLMTHSGVSIYKVKGQHYVMRDKAQTYSYNFEKNNGTNLHKYKVESPNGDILLSPYTWWTFQMTQLTEEGFGALQEYSSKVDLVLEGSGTYLDEREASPAFIADLNLSEYYATYDPSDDEMVNIGETPTESSIRQCGMSPSFRQHSTQAASHTINQGLPFPNIHETGHPSTKRCPVKVKCDEDKTHLTFAGKYSLHTNPDYDDFGDYLKAMGFSEDYQTRIRSIRGFGVIITEMTNSTYYVETMSNGTRNNMAFDDGIEFKTLLGDGRAVRNTISVNVEDKSAMSVIKQDNFEATTEFMFCSWGFKMTLKAIDAEAVFIFTKGHCCKDGDSYCQA